MEHLSPDLHRLEAELAQGAAPRLPALLRERVARGVARELSSQRRKAWGRYVAAVAAGVVMWINLSWSATRESALLVPQRTSPAVLARQIEQLIPDISPHEAARQAILLSGQ